MLQCEVLLLAGVAGGRAASSPMFSSRPQPSAPRNIQALATRSAMVGAWDSGGTCDAARPCIAFIGVSVMARSMVRLRLGTARAAQWDDRSRSITTAHRMTTP